jgi:multidrug efflux pump
VRGQTTIFVDLKGSTPQAVVCRHVVRGAQARRRHAPHAAAGRVGPFFNDDFGDTFGIIYGFTADGFTQRELRDHVEPRAPACCCVPDVSKVEILGAQDERIFIEFSIERLAGLGLNYPARSRRCRRRTSSALRRGETGEERLALRVSGAFETERHPRRQLRPRRRPAGSAWRHRRGAPRLRRPAAADVPRQRQPAIGLAIAMRDGGDILALGRNIGARWRASRADLPIGIEPRAGRRPGRVTVDEAIGDFMESLWQAIADHHGRSASSPRRARRARWWRCRSRSRWRSSSR